MLVSHEFIFLGVSEENKFIKLQIKNSIHQIWLTNNLENS